METPEETHPPRKRYYLLVLQAIVSLALIGWIVSRFELARAVAVVGRARIGYVAAGFVAANCVMILLGVRFACVLRKGRLELPWTQAIGISWVGQFWNFFLPGSTGGDLYRLGAMWAAHPNRKADASIAVFVDRVIATALLALLAGVGVFVLPLASALNQWMDENHFSFARLDMLAVAVFGVVTVVLAIGPLRRCVSGLGVRVMGRLSAGRVFLMPDRRLAEILALALAGHLANFLVFFCYARAVGLEVGYGQVCFMLPIVLIVLILPISINGHGVREVLLVLLLAALGFGSADGVALLERVIALSVVGLSSDFVIGLSGGVAFAVSRWAVSRVSRGAVARDSVLSPK
jgi:uncharacterized membrane protein YbhN (UPF0104 family)